jgi:FixJ family two-component response regulator
MNPREPTVFVVDDDASHLSGVGRLLRASGYEVETFSSASELLDRLPRDAAGCIVSDLKMPGMDGLELQRELERSGTALPIVFLTAHGDIPASVTAMRGGAEDFLVKTAPADRLIAAIERALARESAERETRVRRAALRARFGLLTPREREVLTHVVRGWLNKQIAAELDISERSVKRHRTHLMRKLEAGSVAELVRLVAEAGIDLERED